jgi:hypothetical protein
METRKRISSNYGTLDAVPHGASLVGTLVHTVNGEIRISMDATFLDGLSNNALEQIIHTFEDVITSHMKGEA